MLQELSKRLANCSYLSFACKWNLNDCVEFYIYKRLTTEECQADMGTLICVFQSSCKIPLISKGVFFGEKKVFDRKLI